MSYLENMIDDNLRYLLKLLSKKDKGALRASSTTLLRRINELENTFKVWKIRGRVDSTKLRKLADEISIIQELEFTLRMALSVPVFKYFVNKHQELATISMFQYNERIMENEEDIVLTVFSHLNLRSITIRNIKSAGNIFGRLPSTLPNLEKLVLTDWVSLWDKGLIEILNRSENIRELDLSGSVITGVGVKEGVNSLPNLETLKLYLCRNLTDGGLKEILRLSGNKLRVLNASWTYITGQGFKEGVSLPMLEKLYLDGCKQLTDSGLLEILSISGNRLKTVNVAYTRISSEVISTLRTQYPSVKFTYW